MNSFVNQGLWIASGLLLFVIALVRFNRPPTNRSGTTFLLFHTGVFFYYALLIGIWLFVILLLSSGGAGLDEIGWLFGRAFKANEQLSASLPVVAMLLVAIASQFKLVRKMDAGTRQFCIQLAAIPTEAEQLAQELAHGGELQIVDPKLLDNVTREISQNIGQNALNFANDGTVASRFTRAVALYWLFIMPDNPGTPLPFPANASTRSTYARIMRLNEKAVEQSISLYASLLENGLAYFTSKKPTRQMEEVLKRSIDELSQVVCSLIARFVLYQEMTANQRRRRLSSMGLNARDHGPVVGRDQWIASILAITILFLFMSVVVPGRQPFSQLFMYSVMMAIQLGIAVIAGTIVAQRFIQRNEGAGGQFPPLAELVAAGLVVVGVCILLRIGWPLVPNLVNTGKIGLGESLNQFSQRWPFVLLPFICTLSIGALCSYLGAVRWAWIRVVAVGAILNGLAFMLAGTLISILLDAEFLRQNINEQVDTAKIYIVSTTSLTGFVLGAIVLSIFPRSMRAAPLGAIGNLSLSTAMQNIIAPSIVAPEEISLEAENTVHRGALREVGGYSRDSVAELEGSYVYFRPMFNNPEVINAYQITISWDERRACLVFEEQNRVDARHAQKGQVFIPDGRPFMSLVTVDRGAVRVIMVSRPDDTGIARGLILTLANPGGVHFIPASAPVVMERVAAQMPQLGFVQKEAPDYKFYVTHLNGVAPEFGIHAEPAPEMRASQFVATTATEDKRLNTAIPAEERSLNGR